MFEKKLVVEEKLPCGCLVTEPPFRISVFRFKLLKDKTGLLIVKCPRHTFKFIQAKRELDKRSQLSKLYDWITLKMLGL